MKHPVISKATSRTLGYIAAGRGDIPCRICYALSGKPLAFRTFGDIPVDAAMDENLLEKTFGGTYLMMMVTAGVVNRFLHAPGTVQTLYADGLVSDYFRRHGLTDCGIWDRADDRTLDAHITMENHDPSWCYSFSKPFAIMEEISRARTEGRGGQSLPILFHDSDLTLRKAYDKILGLSRPDEIKMAFGHLEAVGLTDFYPPFSTLHLPDSFRLEPDGFLLHLPSGRRYRTDLTAVNTCLMYFSDLDFAWEWAELFRDLMIHNHLPGASWIQGEQHLLAFDQRTALMVADRRHVSMSKTAAFLPICWEGTRFTDLSGAPTEWEWHHYRPDWADPVEEPKAARFLQDVHHLWISKGAVERHCAYGNYIGTLNLELIRALCPLCGLSWGRLEERLRSFASLRPYFALLDTGRPLEELLDEEKKKPVPQRMIDDKLIKNLSETMVCPFPGKPSEGGAS